jgi:predicted DNA-binding transcriptional regulator YafY
MGVNKDQLKRFFKIDEKIKNGKKATIAQLALAWNNSCLDDDDKVTERTIANDIKAIQEVFEGAEIEEKIEGKYYSYADHKFSIKQLNLNENDEVFLSLLRMTLQNFINTGIYSKFNKFKTKVLQEDKSKATVDSYSNNYILPEVSYGKSGYEWIETLFEAIKNEWTIEIVYRKNSNEISTKTLSPYILKEFRKRWYLIAYDHAKNRNCTRVYALDKIKDVIESSITYYPDPFFNSNDYFKYTFGIHHELVNKPIDIVLDFKGPQIDQLINHPLMATQKSTLMEGGKVLRVELQVYNSYEIKREILGYGDGVKVIKPESLANEIKEMAQSIVNQYK